MARGGVESQQNDADVTKLVDLSRFLSWIQMFMRFNS